MSEVIDSLYQIVKRIRREGDAVVYLGKHIAGECAGMHCMLKRYEPEIPAEAEPAYTNGMNRFIKDCSQVAQIRVGGCALDAARFVRANQTIVMVSHPFGGVPVKEYWRTTPMRHEDKLRMLMPVLQTVAAMNRAGVQYAGIHIDNVYIAQGKPVLAEFGTCEAFEPWRQVHMLGRFIQDASIDILALPHAQTAALRRAQYTDPATRYPNADVFVGELILPVAPGAPMQTSAARPNAGNPRQKAAARAVVVVLIVFLALGGVTVSLLYARGTLDSGGSAPVTTPVLYDPTENSDLWEQLREDIFGADFGDAEPVFEGYEDYEDYWEYDNKREVIEAAYVRYDFWDEYSLYNGLVAEYGDMVYYRIREKGDIILMSENIHTGAQTPVLYNFMPAFLTADANGIYFVDCLDVFRMYYLAYGQTEAELVTDNAAVFLVPEGQDAIVYVDMQAGGVVARLQKATGEVTYSVDAAVGCLTMDAENGVLYYADVSNDDELCALDIKTGAVTPLGLYGYDLQFADGSLYYISNSNTLYRYDTAEGKNTRLLRADIYAYLVYSGSLYYIDGGRGYNVYRVDLDGRNSHLVVRDDVDMIWGAGGKLYYASYTADGAMMRCELDGSGVVMLDRP